MSRSVKKGPFIQPALLKRVQEMNLAAAKFFRECLFDENLGAEAMKYLHEDRKLSMTTIKRFGLGFSPNNAWLLTNHMHRLGFTDEELVAAMEVLVCCVKIAAVEKLLK